MKNDDQKTSRRSEIKPFIIFAYGILLAYGFWLYNSVKGDDFNRWIDTQHKQQIQCPVQTQSTGVLLIIGQSNAANHAERKYTTQFPERVVNYFQGKCYVAASPLLGSTGDQGEFITPLADELIKNGTFQNIVILSSAIGGTAISRWQEGGDLNRMLMSNIKDLQNKYQITDIFWHQGEEDFFKETSQKDYVQSFESLMGSLQKAGVKAKVFIAVSTKCSINPSWKQDNPISLAQQSLVDNQQIFLGINSDAELEKLDRRVEDECHFSASGQEKAIAAYTQAIQLAHQVK